MLKKISVTCLVTLPLMLAGGYAATTSESTQAQLDKIQQQITALQAKIHHDQARPSFSKHEHMIGSGIGNYLSDDDAQPGLNFEQDYASTSFAVDLLKNKDKYGMFTVGGYIEQDTQYFGGSESMPHGSQVYVTTANVDMMANINDWTTAFVSAGIIGANQPTLQDNKGFITFGNLDRFPLYLSVGRDYVPFGAFGGNGPWSANLTRILFRSDEINEAVFGYEHHGLGTSITVFNGNSEHHLNDFAYSADYEGAVDHVGYVVGAGYLNDMRGTTSNVVESTLAANPNAKRTPAWDVNASASYGLYSLSSELVSLTHSINGSHGIPRSWYFNGSYAPMLMGKTTIFDASFSQSTHFDGLTTGLNAPLAGSPSDPALAPTTSEGVKNMWLASVSREITPNIVPGLEFLRYETYAHHFGYAYTLDISVFF